LKAARGSSLSKPFGAANAISKISTQLAQLRLQKRNETQGVERFIRQLNEGCSRHIMVTYNQHQNRLTVTENFDNGQI
jgi:hypothetical protein